MREQLRAGRDAAEVIDYMTARYGDFVRYRPPLKESTLLLWSGPGLMLLGGLLVLWRRLARQQREALSGVPLSTEEAAEADRLLRAP